MAKKFSIQLADHVTRSVIQTSGGFCYVATAGASSKIAIATTATGAAATSNNPIALTNGKIEFWTANTVTSVDLYVQCPGGEFLVAKTITPSGPNELYVDTNQKHQTYIIPFDIADTTAATETDTGFNLMQNAAVLPDGLGVHVVTVDATESMDVGLLASETGGDANGLIAVALTSAAGMVPAAVGYNIGSNSIYWDQTGGTGEHTYGAMMAPASTLAAAAEGTDVDTEGQGFNILSPHVGDGTAESISYTLTAGTDTAIGFIVLPIQLPAV